MADEIGVNDQTLWQVLNGVRLPSGEPRGIGPGVQKKLSARYPTWASPSRLPPNPEFSTATDPAALLQALATHLTQVDPAERAALGAMFNTWVLTGGKPSMTAMLAEMVAPPKLLAQETTRRAA